MKLEAQEDDAAFVFTFTSYVNDIQTNITAATIVIKNPGGTELVASVAMSGTGTPTVTHTEDLSASPSAGEWEIARNYIAVLTIDGIDHIQLLDIVRYPFINEVNIDDLRNENRDALDIGGSKIEGTADSGSTTTVVDSTKVGADTFAGGAIEIYPADNSERSTFHTVDSFTSGTGTFTFSPARDDAVATNQYTVRRSYDEDITRAGDLVKSDLWKKTQRAYLILDNTQVRDMIVYKFFERLFIKRRKAISDDNSDHIQYLYYRDQFNNEYDGLPLAYDSDDDGIIDADEEAIKDGIRLLR